MDPTQPVDYNVLYMLFAFEYQFPVLKAGPKQT